MENSLAVAKALYDMYAKKMHSPMDEKLIRRKEDVCNTAKKTLIGKRITVWVWRFFTGAVEGGKNSRSVMGVL